MFSVRTAGGNSADGGIDCGEGERHLPSGSGGTGRQVFLIRTEYAAGNLTGETEADSSSHPVKDIR